MIPWQPSEREALRWPLPMPSAEWAEANVRLGDRDSAVGGKLDLTLTPYMRGLFDAIDDPGIDTITIVSGAQLGKSTWLYSVLAYLTAQAPGPVLCVWPAEEDARDEGGGRLRQFVRDCPALADQVANPDDLTKDGFYFAACNWHFGWAAAPRTLARRPCRYLLMDEIDKFPPFVGREADPISLAEKRLRTYRNTVGVKSLRATTPTTQDGPGWKQYILGDQRQYHVPCPHCGKFQVLDWANVRWPHKEDGHSIDGYVIARDDLARYVCCQCGAEWTNAQRVLAIRRGMWAPKGQTVDAAGRLCGEPAVVSSHASFHVSALYSAFTGLSELANRWLQAQAGGVGTLQDFMNAELGLPWHETDNATVEEQAWKLRWTYNRGEVDPTIRSLVVTVDVQKDYYYATTWGYAHGLRSWLIDWRVIQTEEELRAYIGRGWRRGDREMHAAIALIDSGDQTSHVYSLCQTWRDLPLRPTKGDESIAGAAKVVSSPITRDPKTGRAFVNTIMLYRFDTTFWKDTVARWATPPAEEGGEPLLHLPRDVDAEFIKQFCSEEKRVTRHRGKAGRSGIAKRVWMVKGGGSRPNHYWDCAVMAAVASDAVLGNFRAIPDPAEPVASVQPRTVTVGRPVRPIRSRY